MPGTAPASAPQSAGMTPETTLTSAAAASGARAITQTQTSVAASSMGASSATGTSSTTASSRAGSTRPGSRGVPSNMLTAPAPLPRIPGFSPAPTPDSLASARTPIPHNPTPPARRRAASFSFDPEDLDVPLADSLLLQRSKHLMRKCHDLLDDDALDSSSVRVVSQLLEVLEHGTEAGKPVAVSGARLQIDPPQITAPPRTLQVGPTSLDSLNWNKLILGLDRFDPKKKLANLREGGDKKVAFVAGGPSRGQEQLVGRIMQARDYKSRTLYSQAANDRPNT